MDGDVRLIQRSAINTGVFQLCHGGVWGTLCIHSIISSDFSTAAAKIACRLLDFEYGKILV